MIIEAILFDWGGTLAHVDGQAVALKRAAGQVIESLVGRPEPAAVEGMVHAAVEAERRAALDAEHREVDLADLLRTWASQHDLPLTEQQVEAALGVIGHEWVGAALTPVPGVHETLRSLREAGLRIGLVSNCFIPVAYCWDELRHQGLADLLDGAAFSSDVGYRKPSPRIYEAAIQMLARGEDRLDPRRILFVGDSPAYDVIAPAGLGMHTALVRSQPGFWLAADHERARPDIHIESVNELPSILVGMT